MRNSKFVLMTFLLGLLFIAFSPQEIFAQSNRKEKKETREKSNNRKDKTTPARVSDRGRTTATTPTRVSNRNRTAGTRAPARVSGSNRTVVTTTPRGNVIRHSNVNYRYDRGIFYRPQGNGFVATRPPLGIRITILPPNYVRIYAGNRPYYYHNGVYFNSIGNDYYEVIDPPIGARISQIPPYNEVVYLDGREYYLSEGIYYKVVQNNDGSLAYEVTGFA